MKTQTLMHFLCKTNLLILVVCFASANAFAQKKQSPSQDDFMKEMIFRQIHNIFWPETKTTPTARDKYIFPWELTDKLDKHNVALSLDTVAKNLKLQLVDGELELSSRFPANFKAEQKLFSIHILSSDIATSANEKIEVNKNINFLNFGSQFASSFKVDNDGNQINTNVNYVTVSRKVTLMDKKVPKTGIIQINCKYIVGYQYLKLTKADIDKEVMLSTMKIKLLSINKGVAVVKILEGSSDFDYLVTNQNNLPYNGAVMKSSLSAIDYDYFKSLPSLTLKEFALYYDKNKDRLLSKDANRNIVVLNSDGEIVNLYIYTPSESINKQMDVKL